MTDPDRTPGEELSDLRTAFKTTADPRVRKALILGYTPLVKFIATRVQARSILDGERDA